MQRIAARLTAIVSIAFLSVFGAAVTAGAEESTLRLNFGGENALRDTSGAAATLDDMLSLSPRTPGLTMTINPQTQSVENLPGIGLGFGDRAFGLEYELFTSFSGVHGGRNGLSGLQANAIGGQITLSDHLSLGQPIESPDQIWAVGGRLGYGGFTLDADFARQSRLQDQAEYRDYRLGVSYSGTDWRIGMQYMRSLSSAEENVLGVADAVEFGGTWNLNGSVNLVGGVQFWDQVGFNSLDNTSTRDALFFVGTRIQF